MDTQTSSDNPDFITLFIKYALQPLMVIGVMTAWYFNQTSEITYPLTLLVVIVVLGSLEHWRPLRPNWVQPPKEKALLVSIYLAVFAFSAMVAAPIYAASLEPGLEQLRVALGLNFWPSSWPMIAQMNSSSERVDKEKKMKASNRMKRKRKVGR